MGLLFTREPKKTEVDIDQYDFFAGRAAQFFKKKERKFIVQSEREKPRQGRKDGRRPIFLARGQARATILSFFCSVDFGAYLSRWGRSACRTPQRDAEKMGAAKKRVRAVAALFAWWRGALLLVALFFF
nr:hypothetical protein [Pandoravirus massiliensis]